MKKLILVAFFITLSCNDPVYIEKVNEKSPEEEPQVENSTPDENNTPSGDDGEVVVLPVGIGEVRVKGCVKEDIQDYTFKGYYDTVAQDSPANLKKSLNLILRNHYSYEYECVWIMLEEADQSPEDPQSIIGIYSRKNIVKSKRDNSLNGPDSWNREHVWPSSHGFKDSKTSFAYSDINHLKAEDKSVNGDRGNKDFKMGGTPNSDCNLCLESDSGWEPPDIAKGVIARSLFYMDVRYDGNDKSGVPDLSILKDETSTENEPHVGNLCVLLKWHELYPVSDEERKRNGVVYSWQGNRNPFIDNPAWVEILWGTSQQCE